MLHVTEIELISSIGNDFENSCAAYFAGIDMTSSLSHYTISDKEDEFELLPVAGSSIFGYFEGFDFMAFLIRSSLLVLNKFILRMEEKSRNMNSLISSTALIAVLPEMDEGRYEDEIFSFEKTPQLIYWEALIDLSSLNISKDQCYTVTEDNVGFSSALSLAEELVDSSKFSRFLIISSDSFIDTISLNWLEETELLSSMNPNGLTPSQAASIVFLETERHCQNEKIPPLCTCVEAVQDYEENNFYSDELNNGKAMSVILGKTLDRLSEPFDGIQFTDFNGEKWRSIELAMSRVLLNRQYKEEVENFTSCECFGHTGSAVGSINLALYIYMLSKGYDKAALFSQSNWNGNVGSFLFIPTVG